MFQSLKALLLSNQAVKEQRTVFQSLFTQSATSVRDAVVTSDHGLLHKWMNNQ